MRLLERLVLDFPVAVIAALALATAALLPGLWQMRFDVSAENFVPDTDAERINYRELIDSFGNDTFVLALLPVDDPFSDEALVLARSLGEELRDLPAVASVFSIADAVLADRSGPLPAVRPLVGELPLSQAQRSELRGAVLSHALYRQKVVSADGAHLLVSIFLDEAVEGDDLSRAAAVRSIQQVLGSRGEAQVTGVPLLKTQISEAVHHDIVTLAPAVALVSFLILWLASRSLKVLLLGAANVGMALVWTLSLFSGAGLTLNMATNLLPSLVMAITFAQMIFIFAHYRRARGGPAERVAGALRKATPPCFLAAVTTAAGFLSLTATTVIPVRDFGLFAALGIAFAFVISITLVPSALRLWPLAGAPVAGKDRAGGRGLLVRLSYKRSWIAAATLIVIVFSALGAWQVKIETSPYTFFPEDHPLNQARRSLRESNDVASTIDLMVRRRDGVAIESQALAELAILRDEFLRHPLVSDSLGLLPIGELLAGGEARFIESMDPDLSPVARQVQLRILRSNPLFRRYISDDGTNTRLTLMLRDHSAEAILRALEFVEAQALAAAPGLEVVPTGQTVLFTRMVDDLFLSQVTSIALIIVFVTFVLILAFRSLPVGLISLIPNVAPIVLTLGLMGWIGIPLNVLTIMVAGIAIGIAVDDTIHFMYYLHGKLAEGLGYDEAVDAAIEAKSRPIILTSLLLTAAFLTYLLSSFRPTIYLGALTSLTMIGAMIGDLVLLPAFLRLLRPRFRTSTTDRKGA